jgi:MarR family transcriptional regulator, lower aerobic nicotinate degradation pathway regulator
MIAARNARASYTNGQMNTTDAQIPTDVRRPRPPAELRTSTSYLLKKLGFSLKERTLQAYESTGLSPYDHGVLALLDEDPCETQAMIADALGYDRSHLVGVLDDLEERGLVARRRDPADRRRHLVRLTPAGKEAVVRLREVARQIDDAFFEALDPGERAQLTALLSRVAVHHDPRYGPEVS